MGKSSLFTVAIIGVVGFLIVCLFMVFILNTFKDSPAGVRTKLAGKMQKIYKFDEMALGMIDKGKDSVLRVEYRTTREDQLGDAAAREEMTDVALYAIKNYTAKDKDDVAEISIVRHETVGPETRKMLLTIPNPLRKEKGNPYDWDD
ncbi:MAG: hypothetical protein ACYTAF_02820 [Planctomycetota bacterium]|jgi:cation transport regulator ChaB